VDLVTINQGLHHLNQAGLMDFLAQVKRILRPGGLFIVREHDATPDLLPVLDLAHSVFNAVLGVSPRDERAELRAFRPVAEWIEIMEAAGLSNTHLYVCLTLLPRSILPHPSPSSLCLLTWQV
jgi:SAM-dependent methyltransferase